MWQTVKRCRRVCIKGDKIIVRSLSWQNNTTRNALWKPFYTDTETINPYLPNGICDPYQLDKSTCHLGLSVSCFISILFRIWGLVSKQCRPWSDAEFCDVLIWVCSVSLCPFVWDTRCIWVNAAIHDGRSYILLHPRESSGMYFLRKSASQLHFKLHLLIYLQCQTEYGLGNRISDWLVHGDAKHSRECILGMHLVVRSHVLRATVYINRIWVNGMDVYKNKNTSSKYFDATNAVSDYV